MIGTKIKGKNGEWIETKYGLTDLKTKTLEPLIRAAIREANDVFLVEEIKHILELPTTYHGIAVTPYISSVLKKLANHKEIYSNKIGSRIHWIKYPLAKLDSFFKSDKPQAHTPKRTTNTSTSKVERYISKHPGLTGGELSDDYREIGLEHGRSITAILSDLTKQGRIKRDYDTTPFRYYPISDRSTPRHDDEFYENLIRTIDLFKEDIIDLITEHRGS